MSKYAAAPTEIDGIRFRTTEEAARYKELKGAGPSKYRAKPTTVDGIRFASAAEARRYGVLKLLESAGEISELELQPRFDLYVNGIKVAVYVGDFSFRERGTFTVEDVKGVLTPVYRLKAKLMLAIHGIAIREVA